MTKNHPELKACPWCGSHPKHTHTKEFNNHYYGCSNVMCPVNPCSQNPCATEREAALLWNARPSPIIPEDAVTIVELREILGIKNKADESVIEHVKEIIRINKRLFADWQKTFFEETDAKNAVQPVTDDDLRDAILDAQNFIDDKYEGSITRSTVQTLVTRAIKGRSK